MHGDFQFNLFSFDSNRATQYPLAARALRAVLGPLKIDRELNPATR